MDTFTNSMFEVGVYKRSPSHIAQQREEQQDQAEPAPLYVLKDYKEILDPRLSMIIKVEERMDSLITEGTVIDCIVREEHFGIRIGNEELSMPFSRLPDEQVWFCVSLGHSVHAVTIEEYCEDTDAFWKSAPIPV